MLFTLKFYLFMGKTNNWDQRPVPMCLLGSDGTIAYFNEAFRKLVPLKRGKPISGLFTMSDDADRVERIAERKKENFQF